MENGRYWLVIKMKTIEETSEEVRQGLFEYYMQEPKLVKLGITNQTAKTLASIVVDMFEVTDIPEHEKRKDFIKDVAVRLHEELYVAANVDGSARRLRYLGGRK